MNEVITKPCQNILWKTHQEDFCGLYVTLYKAVGWIVPICYDWWKWNVILVKHHVQALMGIIDMIYNSSEIDVNAHNNV